MRILAVDPGEKQIGLAISDPTGTIANPLLIFKHQSNSKNLEIILEQICRLEVDLVIIGQSLDEEGVPNFAGKRSQKMAESLKKQTPIPVLLWDESLSTMEARNTRIILGVPRKKRHGHMDDLAAAIILQSYLDENKKDK